MLASLINRPEGKFAAVDIREKLVHLLVFYYSMVKLLSVWYEVK
jgi:hypothetical protein